MTKKIANTYQGCSFGGSTSQKGGVGASVCIAEGAISLQSLASRALRLPSLRSVGARINTISVLERHLAPVESVNSGVKNTCNGQGYSYIFRFEYDDLYSKSNATS